MKKAFNEDIDGTWIDWAIEMIREGYESDDLYILVGINKPYHQFELQRLTDKVFADLDLDYEDKPQMIRNYIYYIISSTKNEPSKYLSTLKEMTSAVIGSPISKTR